MTDQRPCLLPSKIYLALLKNYRRWYFCLKYLIRLLFGRLMWTLKNIYILSKMANRWPYLLPNLPESHQISSNPAKYHHISQNLTTAHQVSMNLTKSHISQNHTKSHHISMNLTKISQNLAKSC